MALHLDFPHSPHAVLDPEIRWFPADETRMEKLMPPLVAQLRRKVKEFRDSDYVGASETSKSLLNWWFKGSHLLSGANEHMEKFEYFLENGILTIHTKNNRGLCKSQRFRQIPTF